MARIRSVHPDLCRDRTLAKVSADAERTFIRLWPHLDDGGRALDDPLLLKADLYPVHEHMTAAEVDRDLDELAAFGLVIRYEVNGTAYLSAKPTTWATYQKPRHPQDSKFPAPDDPAAIRRTITAESGSPTAERRNAPADAVTAIRRNATAEGAGERSSSGVGVGGGGVTPERVPAHHDLLRPDATPTLLSEVDDLVAVLVHTHGADAVTDAVRQLTDQRLRFPFPSNVRTALESILGPLKPVVVDEATRAQTARMERNRRRREGEFDCQVCEDSGVIELDDGSCDDCDCKYRRAS